MAERRIGDSNYYLVHGWMMNQLGLKGVALQVYAIIYGFSQDGESEYTGSIQYLCDFCGGVSKPTIIKALKELTEQKYIIRREEVVNNVLFVRYKASLPPVKNLYWGSKETLPRQERNLPEGSKETLPNKEIYTEEHKEGDKEKRKSKKKAGKSDNSEDDILQVAAVLGEHGYSLFAEGVSELQSAIVSFAEFRKGIRKPLTAHALTLLVKKLNEMTTDVYKQTEIINQSIMNGWQGIFPLREDTQLVKQQTYQKPTKADELNNFYAMAGNWSET